MLESVLYIIGGQLNVLQRHVLVTYRELKDAQSKKLDKKVQKTKIVLTQLKIHRKVAKTQSATERYFTKKPHTKRRRSRSKSKSRSMDESGSAKRILKEDHFNVYHEKLLVVSRTQTKPTQESQIDFRSSIATQEQYDRMVAEVRKLQAKFGVIPNVETAWSNLHKPTSITDPKAALNMATRLEASYKKLNEMLVVITKFASSIPGINLEGPFDESFFHKSRKTSTETLKPPTTESEEVLVDTHPPEKKIDLENMATWSELNVDMENIRNNNVKRLSESATKATETARRANLLFKEAGKLDFIIL
ncbi:uncharacterized protein LOC133520011 [Cydia pomonella]|uniref:uncharacterized protein LOC133520011 n=1 Tax=Cydia pomonella TaxID=82600 RepID=UPI002ADD7499|nr:uncharacterized protein LOC133520011 [Cydia pomonella]